MPEPTAHPSNAGRPARARPLVIDGDAVVVERRQGVKSAEAKAASAPLVHGSAAPDAEPSARPSFGRKRCATPLMRRPTPAPDLVFQSGSAARFAQPGRVRDGGLSIFGSGGTGLLSGSLRAASIGALALALLVPAAILVSPDSPVAATIAVEASNGFVLSDLDAGIRPRGGGDVLEVAGLIRNLSGAEAPIPPLHIALAEADGTRHLRPFAAGARTLAAGAALRFRSAVAVPAGTTGDLSVGFAETGRNPALRVEAERPVRGGTGKTGS